MLPSFLNRPFSIWEFRKPLSKRFSSTGFSFSFTETFLISFVYGSVAIQNSSQETIHWILLSIMSTLRSEWSDLGLVECTSDGKLSYSGTKEISSLSFVDPGKAKNCQRTCNFILIRKNSSSVRKVRELTFAFALPRDSAESFRVRKI